jgi:serine protease Do
MIYFKCASKTRLLGLGALFSLFLGGETWAVKATGATTVSLAPSATAAPAVANAPKDFADIVEPLLPSVVNISTTTEIKRKPFPGGPNGSSLEELFRQFFEGNGGGGGVAPSPRKATSLGSGFIVSQEGRIGFIVTCNHLIVDADEIKVVLHDNTELDAVVVGRDPRTDVALLKVVTDKKLMPVAWADSSKLKPGQWLIAIGNPFGLSSTVTVGIISTIARDISARAHGIDYVDGYIQTDASINMGNSGGPMFNIAGQVIAITTFIFTPNGGNIGLGFGIPANQAKEVIGQLKKYGRTKRGWVGVRVQQITKDIADALDMGEPKGALVGEVADKGPGKQGGLQTNDIILKFNNQDVKDSKHLPHIVGETEIGTAAPVEIMRNGKKMTITIKVGEFEKAEDEGLINVEQEQPEKIEKATKVIGLVTREITPGMKDRYSLPADIKGVLITYVDPNSEAFLKGLRPGDIIKQVTVGQLKIEPETPKKFEDFIAAQRKAGKNKALLLVNTQGNLRYVALSLEEKKSKSLLEEGNTPDKETPQKKGR